MKRKRDKISSHWSKKHKTEIDNLNNDFLDNINTEILTINQLSQLVKILQDKINKYSKFITEVNNIRNYYI